VFTVKNYDRENLQLSTDSLETNSTPELWEKCAEIHDQYPLDQQGGPLMLSIMMRLLQSHSDNAVQYLINSVKNLKITHFEGENVQAYFQEKGSSKITAKGIELETAG
jgi:hypothetical protein